MNGNEWSTSSEKAFYQKSLFPLDPIPPSREWGIRGWFKHCLYVIGYIWFFADNTLVLVAEL